MITFKVAIIVLVAVFIVWPLVLWITTRIVFAAWQKSRNQHPKENNH